MSRVAVIILHAVPVSSAGPLERAFAEDRRRNADRQAHGFAALGATVEVIETERDGLPFGQRLRGLARDHGLARTRDGAGLVVLGSGSIPLAQRADRAMFVAAAAGSVAGRNTRPGRNTTSVPPTLLTNNRYSGDILAIPTGIDLEGLPDLAADNAVPRWVADRGFEVHDLRGRWHLQVDLDSPLDVVLASPNGDGQATDHHSPGSHVRSVLERARSVAADPAAEFLIAGRTSSTTLRWVERKTASRTRALVEERGMKTAPPGQRPSRSALGLLLDADGPSAISAIVEKLAEAAVVDTRVLMAHHFGRTEAAWPGAEDRFASDLLLSDQIRDPWLRALTTSAANSRVPILLGGHTLVGPGLRLALRPWTLKS